MSKIGKKPIIIPSGTTVTFSGGVLSVKGSKHEIKREIPSFLDVTANDGKVLVFPKDLAKLRRDKQQSADWGLTRALVNNAIKGVSEGFKEVLEFQGVGFKAAIKGENLEMSLGFSHPVHFAIPDGILIVVEKGSMTITGIDKELVGSTAARIRAIKVPEPYKGTGIKYSDEVIRRKAGKKAVASG